MGSVLSPAGVVNSPARPRLCVWHLMVLVAYVAIAVVDVQGLRAGDRVLVAAAVVGYAGYAVLAWLAWIAIRPLERRLGAVGLFAVYVAGMAVLYLVATVAYLLIQHAYLFGRL